MQDHPPKNTFLTFLTNLLSLEIKTISSKNKLNSKTRESLNWKNCSTNRPKPYKRYNSSSPKQ
jgi:hypothetical protein